MKRFICILLVIISFAAGCSRQETSETPEAVYEAYRKLALEDLHKAQRKYVYFATEEQESLAFGEKIDVILMETERMEQLSADLWVFYIRLQNEGDSKPRQAVNFVGRMGEKYWVIPGKAGMPEELSKGVDLSEFPGLYDSV